MNEHVPPEGGGQLATWLDGLTVDTAHFQNAIRYVELLQDWMAQEVVGGQGGGHGWLERVNQETFVDGEDDQQNPFGFGANGFSEAERLYLNAKTSAERVAGVLGGSGGGSGLSERLNEVMGALTFIKDNYDLFEGDVQANFNNLSREQLDAAFQSTGSYGAFPPGPTQPEEPA